MTAEARPKEPFIYTLSNRQKKRLADGKSIRIGLPLLAETPTADNLERDVRPFVRHVEGPVNVSTLLPGHPGCIEFFVGRPVHGSAGGKIQAKIPAVLMTLCATTDYDPSESDVVWPLDIINQEGWSFVQAATRNAANVRVISTSPRVTRSSSVKSSSNPASHQE